VNYLIYTATSRTTTNNDDNNNSNNNNNNIDITPFQSHMWQNRALSEIVPRDDNGLNGRLMRDKIFAEQTK